jgi:hypothetical protein
MTCEVSRPGFAAGPAGDNGLVLSAGDTSRPALRSGGAAGRWATHNGPVSPITCISRAPGVRRLVRRHKSDGVVAESPNPEDRDPPSSSTKPVPSRLASP